MGRRYFNSACPDIRYKSAVSISLYSVEVASCKIGGKQMKNKPIAIMTAIAMVVSLLPTFAFAVESAETIPQ